MEHVTKVSHFTSNFVESVLCVEGCGWVSAALHIYLGKNGKKANKQTTTSCATGINFL